MRSVAEICQKFLSDLLGLWGKRGQNAGALPVVAVSVSNDGSAQETSEMNVNAPAPPFSRSLAGDITTAEQWYVVGTSGEDPPRLMDMGRGYDSRPAQWSHDSKYLALASQSENFKSQEIRVADVRTSKAKAVFHQIDDRWAEVSDIGWGQESKKIWFTSDQSGFKHLYTVGTDGKDLAQITRGDWEIHNDSFSHDPQWIGDSIYYSSTQAGTAERQIYRVGRL